MFAYYLQLGLRSLKRNPILTALMVAGIALGIAASMTTLTVLHLMGSDPIPWKSDKLHYVQLDNWSPDEPARDDGSPPRSTWSGRWIAWPTRSQSTRFVDRWIGSPGRYSNDEVAR